ncbi:MAG: response regulator transcription factor [Erysipelotrichaceae bacterium]
MEKILIIEDEANLRKIMSYDIKQAGYACDECEDGATGLDLALKNPYDLILIDWMLPKVSGIDIVKRLREDGVPAIIFMVTARDDESDILHAFELGVDDYISKPFSPRELLARIKVHLKRNKVEDTHTSTLGSLTLQVKRREAKLGERVLELTKKEFDLLAYLVRNKNIVLSRDAILNEIWGFDYDNDTRIVDVHIFKLRNKLSDSDIHIKSNRGVGYLIEELHVEG